MRNLKIINIITKIILIIILVSMGIPFQAYGQIDMTRSSIPVPYNTLFNIALKNNYSPFSDIWINVKDNASASNTTNMIFGNHQDASYGIDKALGEKEAPPMPPGFGVVWVNIPGRVNQWGVGLLRYDYRDIPTNSEKKDTFKLRFQNGEAPNADFVFKWPNADYLTQRCDSMFIYNPLLGSPINMFTTDSLVIPATGDNGIYTLTIYKYGCRLLELIRPNGGEYFYIGSTDTIKWQSFGINTVQLEYSTDAGSSWSLIAGSVPASNGIFTWDIPNAPTNKAKIRLSDSSDTNVFDESDTTFTIQHPPVMTVVPDSFAVSLNEGDSTSRTMTIGNVGLGDLQWEITASSTSIKTMESLKIQYFSKSTVSDPSLPFMNTDFLDMPPNRFQYTGQNISGVYFSDGFEDGDYNGWTSLGTGTKEVTNATAANGTEYSFHEYNSPGGHDLGVVHYLGSLQPKYVSVYIRSGSTSTSDAYFVPRSSFGSFPFWIYASESGQIRVGGNSWSIDAGTYVAQVWYHAEFKNISWSDSTFDFYLDGNLIQSGLSLEGSSDVASIYLYNYDAGSEGWWDEIYIGDANMDWWNITPTSGTVPSGSTQDVNVKFNAKDLRGGDYHATIVIESNDPVNSRKQVPAHLHVIGAPNIVVSDDTLDFGDGFIGYNDTLMLRISNTGSDTLKISGIVIDNSHFTVDGSTIFSVSPDQYRDVGVVFSPTTTGLESGTLTISSNDSSDLTVVVYLRGNGIHPPVMTVVPDSFAVSLNEGDSTSRTMTIGNTGLGELRWSINITSGVVNTNITKRTEQERSNLVREIASHPDGNNAGVPTVSPYSWQEILRVGGTKKILSWVGYTDLSYGGEYENTLNAIRMHFSDFSIDSTSTTSSTVLENLLSDKNIFLVPEQEIISDLTSLGTSFSTVLSNFVNHGGTIIVLDHGHMGATTLLNGTGLLSIENVVPSDAFAVVHDPTSPLVKGLPTTFYALNGSNYHTSSDGQKIVRDSVTGNNRVTVKKIGGGRVIYIGMDYYSYNSEMARLLANAVESSISDFLTVEPNSGVVSSGLSQDVTVNFNAEKLRGGDYHANIVIESNDPVNNLKQVPAHLHVIGAPNIVVSDDTLDFGDGFIGYNDTLMLRISNTGSDTLKISGIVIDNSHFTVDGSTIFSVSPDQYRDVGVVFSPTTTGLESGTLTISSNDSSDLTMLVHLQGNGAHPPVMTVVPDSFMVSLNEGDSTSRTMTIGNTGLGTLHWTVTGTSITENKLLHDYVKPQNEHAGNVFNGVEVSDPTSLQNFNIANDDLEFYNVVNQNKKWQNLQTSFSATTTISFDDTTAPCLFVNAYPLHLRYSQFGVNFQSGANPNGGAIVDSCGNWGVSGFSSPNFLGFNTSATLANGGRPILPETLYFSIPTAFVRAQFGLGRSSSPVTITVTGFNSSNSIVARDSISPTFVLQPLEISGSGIIKVVISTTSFNSYYFVIDDLNYGGTPWLSVDPTSGTVAPSATQDVTVQFNAEGLDSGFYTGTMLISSNDPARPLITLPIALHVISGPVGVEDVLDRVPKEFVLSQNYPNPFNPLTKIRYELPVMSQVRLKIYNLLGQEVMTLVDEVQLAGFVAIDWNSTNNAGASVASGIYFYRLEATNIANPRDSFVQVKKLMLIK